MASSVSSWALPPGWHARVSATRGRPYFWHESAPAVTQWHEPSWDAAVAAAYAAQPRAAAASALQRALHNFAKTALLFKWIWSDARVASVLDVGCGKGGDAGKVPSCVQYLGIDVCDASLDEARRRHPEKTFVNGSFNDGASWSAAIGTRIYDAAFSMFAFHYAGDALGDALKRVRAALRTGAPFVLVVLDPAAVDAAPHGRGDLKLSHLESRAPPSPLHGARRVTVTFEGTVHAIPEWLLDAELLERCAAHAGFEVEASLPLPAALTSLGMWRWVEPHEVAQRDALVDILRTKYGREAACWDVGHWEVASMYKAVRLRAV